MQLKREVLPARVWEPDCVRHADRSPPMLATIARELRGLWESWLMSMAVLVCLGGGGALYIGLRNADDHAELQRELQRSQLDQIERDVQTQLRRIDELVRPRSRSPITVVDSTTGAVSVSW